MPSDDQPIDLIIVNSGAEDDDEGVGLYSPQVPDLAAGRASLAQLQQDLPDILRFADVPLPARVRLHVEYARDLLDVPVAVRARMDEHVIARNEVANRVASMVLSDPEQRDRLLSAHRTRTGDVLLICTVPSDRINDLGAQLHPAGDAAVVVCAVDETLIWTMEIANSGELNDTARPLTDWGDPENVTIGEIMERDVSRQRSRPALLLAA